ncbi:glycosyltransferase [Thiolapillus brandeum]|uniref:Glycosyl transferase family 2 n=1 Tax=Thiolapillus brandeum TaxID=1076588 RepID=A0A7U6GKV3_9GAMM|nr:glycosyltransferase [Thiolapillus brandeum]BAO45447.1 glycosyl transferase family 2 [Thiolapillus brandeum]
MLWILFLSLLILVYTYVGYPLLIAFLARCCPLGLKPRQGHTPSVSVLIPVYNGQDFIRGKIESLLQQDYPGHKLEILLCSDASDDQSDAILRESERNYPDQVRVFYMEQRSGKPAILNRLRKEARGEVLLLTDIRQPLKQDCVSKLVARLEIPGVGVVGGMLLLRGSTGAGLYWRYERWIRQSESDFRSVTGVSGSLYVIAAEDMQDMPEDIILDDVWVPSVQRLRKHRVVLEPEAVAWDEAMEDGREFGRKVRTLAGNYQLMARLPALLSPWHNPSWFEFFSHKLMRLVCPWALLTLFVSNLLLLFQEPGRGFILLELLMAGQVVFYVLALLGERAGALGRLARTFVVLNIAAVVGLWRYLSGRQKIAW